jgi:hypothetical protein
LGYSIVKALLSGRRGRGGIWGIGLGDPTIESFNSTRMGLRTSEEESLTRCRVGRSKMAGEAVLLEL